VEQHSNFYNFIPVLVLLVYRYTRHACQLSVFISVVKRQTTLHSLPHVLSFSPPSLPHLQNGSNSMSTLPPKGILPENVYLARLDAIIQRDFFPSLSINNNTPESFHITSSIEGLSLADFFDLYTSDDNASFNKLHQKELNKEKEKHEITDALAKGTGEKLAALRLALENGQDGRTPLRRLLLDGIAGSDSSSNRSSSSSNNNMHRIVPSGVIVVKSKKDLPKTEQKIINYSNTSFSTNTNNTLVTNVHSVANGIGNNNGVCRSSDVMRVGGYSYILTPSATPVDHGSITPGSTPLPNHNIPEKRKLRSSTSSQSRSLSSSSYVRSSKRSKLNDGSLTPAAKALAMRIGGGSNMMVSSIRRHERYRMKKKQNGSSSRRSSSRRSSSIRVCSGGDDNKSKSSVPSWPSNSNSIIHLPKEIGLTDGLLMMLPKSSVESKKKDLKQ
jgi:hypothetical protein